MANAAQSSTVSRSVLLVNPPSPPGLRANREGAGGLGAWSSGDQGFIYPPQTLAATAAVLRAARWQAHVLDAAGEGLDTRAVRERLSRQSHVALVVHVSYISLDNDIAFLNQMRQTQRQPILAVGAGMAQLSPPLIERTDVDHVVLGEPEGVLLPALQTVIGESDVRRLRRVVAPADVAAAGVDAEGRVHDLDALPFPVWDDVPWRRYGFLTVFASRGCNDACTFCPYVIGQGRRLRLRSPRRVVDEMALLAQTYHPARLIMRDPVFAADRAHVEGICEALVSRRLKLAWECESRPEHFDRDLLRLMQRAGCTTIKLGFETTSQSVLRGTQRIGPRASAESYMAKTAELVEICRTLGLACRLFAMTGLPGQTESDIAAALAWLHRMRPAAVHVKAFHTYPGLPITGVSSGGDARQAERQAQMMQQALPPARPPRRDLLSRLQRWLAQGMRR